MSASEAGGDRRKGEARNPVRMGKGLVVCSGRTPKRGKKRRREEWWRRCTGSSVIIHAQTRGGVRGRRRGNVKRIEKVECGSHLPECRPKEVD